MTLLESKHLPTREVVSTTHITLPFLTLILLASSLMQLKGRKPEVRALGFGGVLSPRSDPTYLFWVSANLDGIGDEASCLFFSHGADVFQTHSQLASHRDREGKQARGSINRVRWSVFSRHQFTEEADHRLCASQLLRNFLRDHLVESLISEAVEQASLEAQGFLDSWSGELAFSFVYSLINMHRSHHHLPLTETQNPGTGWDLTVTYLVIISHFIL